MQIDEQYMRRCFELARLGAGNTSPNPMVGAVLVADGRIIGEGWHRRYGQAHAEVNAVADVPESLRNRLPDSTLYVSLEPCCIHGRTPPCTDLIIKERIPRVVVSVIDMTPGVSGKGLAILREAGVEVRCGMLAEEGARLSLVRNTYVGRNRPYVVLKWAQTPGGFMGVPGRQVWISGELSRRLTHRLRQRCDAILVGTNTALTDDPALDNRYWWGRSPLRIVLDREGRLPAGSKLLDGSRPTWILTEKTPLQSANQNIDYVRLPFDQELLPTLMTKLYEQRITSLLVEGGATTLQHFIQHQLWDEVWIFSGQVQIDDGIPAPEIGGHIEQVFTCGGDEVTVLSSLAARSWLDEIVTRSRAS
ncbi:MAG: riboflavin biosynthesis protein RibD [Saprospiraceae bacterium]|nr:MAG: riboflavin biosynthesis protein RibD [Saprospiraceae bacterium]